jgi:glutamyl-tRNA synthetase
MNALNQKQNDVVRQPIRTRFAPSPTGYLHVGGIRTALFAWLVAQQNNGQFILRIEDTDQAREVQGSADHIQESLDWLGLYWDEGPNKDGGHGPYFQSQRLAMYKKWADKLVAEGKAYADPYTADEVQAFREEAKIAKKPFLYRDHRPENPPAWDGSQPLRLKSNPKNYEWHDEVMGDLKSGPEVIDDFIIMKSDGFPTYNFAHIIDDYEMEITHVIRGQEFLASVPKYLNLYEALGFPVPILATMPHILGSDGGKKLSKRDGAKDILEYREEGYLPEAMRNFLASLGWNDGTEQEVFTTDELIQKFSLDRVQKSGARFDERRLLWLNGAHIRLLPLEKLANIIGNKPGAPTFWPPEAFNYDEAYRTQVLGVVQERLKFFQELPELSKFFFVDLPEDMDLIDNNKQLKKYTHSELKDMLEQAKNSLKESTFEADDLTDQLNQLLETTGQKPGILFSLIRIAITWAPASPALNDTLHVLGKEKSLQRITTALHALEG